MMFHDTRKGFKKYHSGSQSQPGKTLPDLKSDLWFNPECVSNIYQSDRYEFNATENTLYISTSIAQRQVKKRTPIMDQRRKILSSPESNHWKP